MEAKILKPTYSAYFLAETSKGDFIKVPRTVSGEIWKFEHLKEGIYRPIEWKKLNYNLRRVPPCGYYPYCSGCQWQHIRPKWQTDFKVQLFEEYVGLKPQKVLTSPSEWGYRIRTLLYWKNGKLGFKKAWFYNIKQPVIGIDYCPLLHSNLNRALERLKGFKFPPNLHAVELLTNPQTGETFIKLLFLKRKTENFQPLDELAKSLKETFTGVGIYIGEYLHWERLKTYGRWETLLKINSRYLIISPDAFVQPNHLLWEEFQKLVEPLEEHKRAVELHAGVGFFTFHLAEFVEEFHSSDIGREAYLLREKGKELNRVKNLRNLQMDAYRHFKKAQNVELLVVDPPRGGLTKPLLGEILRKPPKELIYISCNLESLRRDLELLKEHYKVIKTVLVDQFPNTYHTESVVWLKLA